MVGEGDTLPGMYDEERILKTDQVGDRLDEGPVEVARTKI
jgi:hypothetical protein